MVTQPHLPCSLSGSWAMHNSAPPRLLQKAGRAASSSGGPLQLPPESLPQRQRDRKARDWPSPKGRVSLGQRGTQRCPIPFASGRALELQLTGLGSWGRGPRGPSEAQVLSLSPRGSLGEWHVHRRPRSSAHLGQNGTSRWEGSASRPRYPEARVGNGSRESELRVWVRGLPGCPPGAPAPGGGVRWLPVPRASGGWLWTSGWRSRYSTPCCSQAPMSLGSSVSVTCGEYSSLREVNSGFGGRSWKEWAAEGGGR